MGWLRVALARVLELTIPDHLPGEQVQLDAAEQTLQPSEELCLGTRSSA
jgi:hypothetical protein